MSVSFEVDFLVVGGGPAGSACATLLAQRGARVALVESSDFSRFRIGETIQPSVRSLLDRLGVPYEDLDHWGRSSLGVGSAWGEANVRLSPSLLNPYGRGWRVERRLLDRKLFEHAGAAGSQLFARTRVEATGRRAGWWEFTVHSDGLTMEGRAPVVVEATGRKGVSSFAPRASRLWLDRLVGIAVRGAQDTTAAPLPDWALVEAMPCGWWYSVGLPNGHLLAVLFTDADLLPKKAGIAPFLKEQMERSEATRGRLRGSERHLEYHRWRAFDARTSVRRILASDGWVAIGDAVMTLDPLSGRGFTEALASGIEVAEWLQNRRAGLAEEMPAWVEQVSARFDQLMQHRLRVYRQEDRWRDMPFWERR